MLVSVDKTTLSYAAVFDLREDTHLHGSQYSWLGAIFYVGYFAWEYPTNLLLQKLPIAKYLSLTVFMWGLVLMCHAACDNFASLAAVRTFLGVFECTTNPAAILLCAMWYKRADQPFKLGIWNACGGLAYILAGIASFGIGHIHASIASWRFIFLLFGAFTVLWSFVLWFCLPASPFTATFLTEAERACVIDQVKDNRTGIENRQFKKDQFIETLKDAKTWLLFAFAIASNCPNGGLTTFSGLIIKQMGFNQLQTTLIGMPTGAVQFIAVLTGTFIASSRPNLRCITMMIFLVPFLAGIIGIHILHESHRWGRAACLWIAYTYTATWTLSMSVLIGNTAGHTKKTTTSAIHFMGYCLGNFLGPFFFLSRQAPAYPLGWGMMFFCVAVQFVLIAGILALLYWRNRTRDQAFAREGKHLANPDEDGLLDLTDLKNENFRYVL
ncbi:hypothetical protein A1O1_00641 [Capronia coronata CBS 617.96]|uniref:Major facilitator superfamily (MFS) profile domain-containing protein n=1 Tax=Capronia coronata CBS 617.96 TaxID=1182541 RepID=W9ZM00_9EURO|nr:uncharacterized protein A1O1_00641 [Capronia coronata CBS 617.96]EXJ95519.1 hypothetical protein A1O1_00641 [Capronia coronata CBS 617.96]